jgi:hypothetical protein
MKKALLLCALGTALLGSQAIYAETFAGSASFTDLGPNTNKVSFTGVFDDPSFSFSGGVGDVYTDNLNITGYDLNLADKTQSDNLQVSLTFTLPSPETGTIGGTGTITDTFYGFFWADSDTITWSNNNPATINFADGSQLSVDIANASFGGFDGASWSCDDPVTFTITNVGAAPEPGSLALLGTSILGGAGLLRRRFRV